jgi:protein tyrosine phosphatase type 4A
MNLSTINSDRFTFLIFDAPSNESLPKLVKQLTKAKCVAVVRCCDSSYDESQLKSAGIEVHEIAFADGTTPSAELLRTWLDLLQRAGAGAGGGAKACIGIHCVAGLGRSPLLAAIALIEEGQTPLAAVTQVRAARPGAINLPQLKYLQAYKRQSSQSCCALQ